MQDIQEKIQYIYFETDGIYFFLSTPNISDHSKRCILRRFFILFDSCLEVIGFFKNKLYQEDKISLPTKKLLESEIKDIRSAWENDYEIIRNKISAHHQDINEEELFGWWNEIDYTTITFYFEGMSRIRSILADDANILTHTPTDYEAIDFTGTCLEEESTSAFYLDHDRLAGTKNNTVSMVGINEFQRKCMLILSIVDFVFIDCAVTIMTEKCDTYYKNIIFDSAWLLIACDTVSLIDNLYEDSIYGDSLLNVCPQDWKGLPILKNANMNRDMSFEGDLTTLRNKFAAHIDTDEPLQSLQDLYGNFNLGQMHKYCMEHLQVFQKACHSDIRSQMFSVRGQKLHGDILGISFTGHETIDK